MHYIKFFPKCASYEGCSINSPITSNNPLLLSPDREGVFDFSNPRNNLFIGNHYQILNFWIKRIIGYINFNETSGLVTNRYEHYKIPIELVESKLKLKTETKKCSNYKKLIFFSLW